jgi:hypothetical protein
LTPCRNCALGHKVTITIVREGLKSPWTSSSAEVPLQHPYAFMLNDTIGYIFRNFADDQSGIQEKCPASSSRA